MRVGILTFHNALNYGATLQAYALCEALQKRGVQAEVINYLNPKMKAEIGLNYRSPGASIKSRALGVMLLPKRKKLIDAYARFFDEYMSLSGACISTAAELKALCASYDRIVVGSDQIFNYCGTGDDFNYYLEFCRENEKKIAYAPSFGLKEIDATHRGRVAACLKEFWALSARETVGTQIIRDLTGRDAPLVCDPTFLLEENDWRKIAVAPRQKKPYVLVYAFGSRHLDGVAVELAQKRGAVVVDINRALPSFDSRCRNTSGVSPAEFLGYIENADYVVTNSFHGMALSLNMKKNFTVYTNTYATAENTNARFTSLAKKLGIENHIRPVTQPACEEIVDYEKVTPILEAWRRESLAYLDGALGGDRQ